jgi:N-acetylneuraminic acid mutarotase
MKTIINTFQAIIVIACILILSAIECRGANVIQPQRCAAVGFSIGSKGYIGTGFGYTNQTINYKKDFWEYNPATNSWTQKADFGGGVRMYATGFSLGNKGYIGTGQYGNTLFNDFWEYDPLMNTWVRKADFGGVPRKCATGFSISSELINKGYIGTGLVFGSILINLQDFWEYDPMANNWIQKNDFPGVPRYAAVGFGIGEKGYLGTGINYLSSSEYTFYKDFYEYDPRLNLWTRKADLGGTIRAFAVGFSIDGNGYIGTGSTNGTLLNDFWEYASTEDTWIQKASFGGTKRSAAVGFSIGTKGYIGTGLIAAYTCVKDFWEYDQVTDLWTQKTDYGNKRKGPLKDGIITDENDQAGNSELIVYPNPSSSTFNFRLTTMNTESVTIQIFDMVGRLVEEYKSLSPEDILTIGENLNTGIYIAVVTQGEYRKSVKINKVK